MEPEIIQPTRSISWVSIVMVVILTGLVTGGGVYFYQKNKTDKTTKELQAQIDNLKVEVAKGTNTPTPTATPDPTADWKTHTNTKYSFSFKYPDSYSVADEAEGQKTYEDLALVDSTSNKALQIEGCTGYYFASINKKSDYSSAVLQKYINNEINDETLDDAKVANIKIDGHQAYHITGTYNKAINTQGQASDQTVGEPADRYLIESGNEMIDFSICTRNKLKEGNSSEFSKIIGTFKFTK